MQVLITQEIVIELKKWFFNYVKTFKFENYNIQQNIEIKKEHSLRVSFEIINIAKQLGLNDNELNLSEIIGLFHDIGRFEQYIQYKTFSDSKSEDHSILGIRILKRYNVLNKLNIELQELILRSIKYHNMPLLPTEETNQCMFYSRLLRDADKLDIWRVITNYLGKKDENNVALELELPNIPTISDDVYKALSNKQIVDLRYVKSINDLRLLQAGWIYDINFKPTFDYIKTRRYLELIKESLPKSNKIEEIYNGINSHVHKYSKSF